jgi:hypothetical protein
MASKTSPRDGFIACVRARRILDAIAALRGGGTDVEYEGTSIDGFYARHDGSGNHHVIAWSAEGVVAIDFDHDGADIQQHVPKKDRDPGRWLGGLDELEAARDRVTEYADKRSTGGMWIRGDEVRLDGETRQLDPYLLDVRAALDAWSATEERELVVLLESKSRKKAHKLTKSQQQQLLGRDGDSALASPRSAEAAKILAPLGIIWPEVRPSAAAARQAAKEAADREAAIEAAASLGALQVALLDAVRARDVEATRAVLDAGANVDCMTYKGQLADTPAKASPLAVAMRFDDEAVALLLITRGASLEARGARPPLEWALRSGYGRVVRAVLDRGVVFPEDDGGSTMRLIAEGAPFLADERFRGRIGSAADFAMCLRHLLDVGAPMPNMMWRRRLMAIARTDGADDLVPRLAFRDPNPQHAAHALSAPPPLPPLPAVTGSSQELLDSLRRAVDRSGDPLGARSALMTAWRLTRSARIAEVLEVWDAKDRGYGLASGSAPTIVHALDSALVSPPQPYVAGEALDFLERGGVGCSDCFDRCAASAAAVLVHVADVRTFERFRSVVGSARGDWDLFGAPSALVDAVAALAAFRPAVLDAAASDLLARVEDVAAGRPPPPPNVTPISDLFRAVYEAPSDDGPRRALAERLIAVGDPRGELMTLQLERHASGEPPREREQELVREHGRAWLGAIGWAVRDEALAFERGFVTRVLVGRHEVLRGSHLFGEAPLNRGNEDEWSTVEQLSAGFQRHGTSGLLLSPKLGSLREVVDVISADLDDVLAGVPRSWTSLRAFMTRSSPHWLGARHAVRFEAVPEVLPQLTSLSFGARDVSADLVARVVARLPSLQVLSLAYRWDGLPELVAIAAEHGVRTARLLLLRLGEQQERMLGPADLAVDLGTRVITVEIPGALHDSVPEAAASALHGAAKLTPTALVVALPPCARPEGEDAKSPELPAAFVRKKERMSLAPLWAIGRTLGIPCSVGPELVPHWSPCEEALQ